MLLTEPSVVIWHLNEKHTNYNTLESIFVFFTRSREIMRFGTTDNDNYSDDTRIRLSVAKMFCKCPSNYMNVGSALSRVYDIFRFRRACNCTFSDGPFMNRNVDDRGRRDGKRALEMHEETFVGRR